MTRPSGSFGSSWQPGSILRDALARGACERADEAVVERFAASLDREIDLTALYRFVRKVRGDLGPEAEILQAGVEGPLEGPTKWIVWYRRPGEETPAAAPSGSIGPVQSVGNLATRSATAVPKGASEAAGPVPREPLGGGQPTSAREAQVGLPLPRNEGRPARK